VIVKSPGHFVVLVIGVLLAVLAAVIDFLPLGFLGLALVFLSIRMLDAEIKRNRYGLGPKQR
jgi:hypothetical protein